MDQQTDCLHYATLLCAARIMEVRKVTSGSAQLYPLIAARQVFDKADKAIWPALDAIKRVMEINETIDNPLDVLLRAGVAMVNEEEEESMIPTPENIGAFTERVNNFIETLTEHYPSTDAINTLAQEVNKLLANRQNGMNILALSVVMANVLSDMDYEHRALALAGVVKMVLTISDNPTVEEEAAP